MQSLRFTMLQALCQHKDDELKCLSCPNFSSQAGQINRNTRRLCVDRDITKQQHALSAGTKTTGLLQCFAGKPNTVLLYIAGLFTLCMTARVKSHDSRYMGGQTHARSPLRSTHTHWRCRCGGGEGIRRTLLSWLWRVASPWPDSHFLCLPERLALCLSLNHMLISFLCPCVWSLMGCFLTHPTE